MRVRLGDYIKEYSVKNKNNEDIPVYSVSNSLGFCKDYFGKEVASKNKATYKIVPRGCFAYNPSRINVGSVDWQNEEERVIVSPLYNVFSVSPLLDQQYLLYYLKSNVTQSRIRAVASGSVRDNLKLSMLYEFPIDLISLEQQYDIVSTLNVVQKIIDLYQKELSSLDELVRARFVEMFGEIEDCDKWKSKIWNEVVTIQNGRDYKKVLVSDGGYPVVGTGGEIARSSGYLCPENTIVVGRKGSINNPMLMREKFWNVDTAFGVIPNSDYLHYQYFYYFCKFYNFMKLNKATTLPSTTKADLLKIRINIPPLELQNQFASFVEEIDKSRLLSNHSLFLLKSITF